MASDPESLFMELGFNALEAEVYICLLKNGDQTAYRIGKLINRPTANVYKAVDVLAERGAIEKSAGDVQVCRAIPIHTLSRQLEMNYKSRLGNVASVLAKIQPSERAEGLYTLASRDAVLERAHEMMKRCKKTMVADLFPLPLKALLPDLQKQVARHREVLLQVYEPIELDGASVSLPAVSAQSLKYWKAQQLNLAVDGEEVLLALFNHDMTELVQATYTNNLYLSCILFAGMKSEHQLHKLAGAQNMQELEGMRQQLGFFYNSQVPGIDRLFKRYKKD